MNRTPVVSLALGFVLLVAIFGAVMYFTAELQRAAADLRRNFAITTSLLELLATVQDAETGQRGFLLTGEDNYLTPYNEAATSIGTRLGDLQTVTEADRFLAAKTKELTTAVQNKMLELDTTISIYRQLSPAAAVEIVRGDSGLEQMMRINTILSDMRGYQSDALDVSFANRDAVAMRLQLGVGLGILAVLLFGVLAVLAARRNAMTLAEQTRLAEERAVQLEDGNRRLVSEMEERQAAESQLRQMQKMEAVGQLTGGMAHDFNNMLAVVMSAIGLIRRKMARGETDIDKFLDGAADAAERSATLTRRLLAFSRQQPLEPEPIDANKFVAGMSELLRRTLGESIQLETVLAGGLWRICADASQLENSVINLAANARDAMAEGGKITIETANCHLDEIYARENPGAAAGQFVLIAVTDSGPGMTPEVLARAFDPFFTTKAVGRGTGLGLSQVYGFVKQSDGHIKIYSEVDAGTSVKMYLPRYTGSDGERIRRVAGTEALPMGKASEVVLVTEDDDRVRALAVESLNELGYTVVDARDGDEALAILNGRPDIALLLTDIVMPRMSGRQLADQAQVLQPGLKVLYTTGFTRNAVVHNGVLDAGVMFLPKPFTMGQLAAKVRETLDN